MRTAVTSIINRVREWGPDRCLLGLLCLLAFLLVVQGGRYCTTRLGAWRLVTSLESSTYTPPHRDRTQKLGEYDTITEAGVLGKVPKGGASLSAQLFGIIVDSALFGSSPNDIKPYKRGDEIPGGEKIVEIGADKVVLEKEDEQRTVKVFLSLDDRPAERTEPPEVPSQPETKGVQKPPQPEDGSAPDVAVDVEIVEDVSSNALTAETIAGTTWTADGATVLFLAGGVLKIYADNEEVEGTWYVEGNTITVSVMDEEETGQIEGDTIIINGTELERVE